jgi:hypothetical protein
MTTTTLTCLDRLSGRVDHENHIIRGVSLMRIGPAKGHDMTVDRTTLEQVKALIPSVGLKAKVNHRDASGVMSLNGRMKNPRIVGENLRADWHLTPGRSNTADILSIAEYQPEDAGISLTCHTTKERRDGINYMRVSSLTSADLVDDPAANESLLSSSSRNATELSGLQTAATELEASSGMNKVLLAKKFKRDFGPDWKERLTSLTNLSVAAGSTSVGPGAPFSIELIKLRAAAAVLESSFGINRTLLRKQLDREHGPNWKERLAELSALELSAPANHGCNRHLGNPSESELEELAGSVSTSSILIAACREFLEE